MRQKITTMIKLTTLILSALGALLSPGPGAMASPKNPEFSTASAPATAALDRWRAQAPAQTLIRQALAQQSALLHDARSPVRHDDGAVSIVLFADYQCLFCARAAPLLEHFVQAVPETRVVFKEWPIFGDRWPVSQEAARTGLAIWQQKGEVAYWQYHNAVFATGHYEGALTRADLTKVLSSLKLSELTPIQPQIDTELVSTAQLADTMGLRGTPAIIVMPTRGATGTTTTVLPGMPDITILAAAVQRAKGGHP